MGFLSFKDAKKGPRGKARLSVGHLVETCVTKMSENQKTCNVVIEAKVITSTKVQFRPEHGQDDEN